MKKLWLMIETTKKGDIRRLCVCRKQAQAIRRAVDIAETDCYFVRKTGQLLQGAALGRARSELTAALYAKGEYTDGGITTYIKSAELEDFEVTTPQERVDDSRQAPADTCG